MHSLRAGCWSGKVGPCFIGFLGDYLRDDEFPVNDDYKTKVEASRVGSDMIAQFTWALAVQIADQCASRSTKLGSDHVLVSVLHVIAFHQAPRPNVSPPRTCPVHRLPNSPIPPPAYP